MVMLAGAIAFDGDQSSAASAAAAVARKTARYPQLRERVIHADRGIALYAIERYAEQPQLISWTGDNGAKAWLLGDCNYMPEQRFSTTGADPLRQWSRERVPGRWIAVEIGAEGVLQFATDRLGLAWVYVGRTASGYIFSTDYAAIAEQLQGALTVDPDGVLLELSLGYIPDDTTIFREIELLPPGAVVKLSAAGLQATRAPVRYDDRLARASESDKHRQLDAIYDGIIQRAFTPVKSELVMSISAGYDSRYALAFLDREKSPMSLCTFGHPDSGEVAGARAVCAKVGRSTNLFNFSEGDWEQWRRGIQQLGNAGMVQWSGWADSWCEFLRSYGRFPVIGYLGDALSGKHLGATMPEANDWLGYWERWSTRGGWAHSPLVRPEAKARVAELVRDRLRQAASGCEHVSPHQQALHLDLYGRQRRWVATQPLLLSRFMTPALFFYDNDLFDFWSSVGVDDLLGQRLYRSYAQERFPALFPRNEGRPRPFVARALAKLAAIARRSGANAGRPPPKVIEHQPIVAPNRQHIVDLIGRVAPMVDNLIDVDRLRDHVRCYPERGTAGGHIIRAVNVFLLLDLANGRGRISG